MTSYSKITPLGRSGSSQARATLYLVTSLAWTKAMDEGAIGTKRKKKKRQYLTLVGKNWWHQSVISSYLWKLWSIDLPSSRSLFPSSPVQTHTILWFSPVFGGHMICLRKTISKVKSSRSIVLQCHLYRFCSHSSEKL